MSSVFAPELYQMVRDIKGCSGPWPSDAAIRKVEVLQWAARALIQHDLPKRPLSEMRVRSKAVFSKKKVRKHVGS